MTLYGDLTLGTTKVPGRRPIITKHATADRTKVRWELREAVDEGRQAYGVPGIEELETQAMKAAQKEYEHLRREVFPGLRIGLMHGRLSADEKEAAMQGFKEGRTQVLVSTTVIEVGVDVPNATVMVVEQAERFGLAQLHQLRGRVGRGAAQSYCVLVTVKMNDTARERIRTLVDSTDGFFISDGPETRGPASFSGWQSRVAARTHRQYSRDGELLKCRREA
jgi:ATP-dependent DNA helicase RecG